MTTLNLHGKWCQIPKLQVSGFVHMNENRNYLFPISTELDQFQRMPGFESTLLSGYCKDIDLHTDGLSAIGEMVIERHTNGLQKLYPHVIATDSGNYYFMAVNRRFDGHWQTGSVDYTLAFGKGWNVLSAALSTV